MFYQNLYSRMYISFDGTSRFGPVVKFETQMDFWFGCMTVN